MVVWLLLFACNLMWALQFTCVKLVQDQVGPLFTVWGPMTLATLMLVPIVRREFGVAASRTLRRRSDIGLYLTLALLGTVPAQVFTTWGTRKSLASNAALLQLALPVTTAVLAYFLLKERMTALRWISFVVAIGGVILCSARDLRGVALAGPYLWGNVLIFGGVLGSSFYNSYGKKALERYSPMQMLFLTYVATVTLMFPLVFAQERDVFARIPSFTARTWIGLALLTFFHNFLSMVLFLKALKQLDAIQAALSNYLITAFGVPIAAVWLGERLTAWALAGGVLILFSTLAITVWESRKRPAAVPAPVGVSTGAS